MVRKFYKMHGTGNDYILFDCLKEKIEDAPLLAEKFSPRRFGVGADGVILLCPSKAADCGMRMFNADGSEGKMCGNGIRLVGKLFYDCGYTRKKTLTVETASGIRTLKLFTDERDRVRSVLVDMGQADFSPASVPVLLDGEFVIGREVFTDNGRVKISCVSMGNPHCVLFVKDFDEAEETAAALQRSGIFPEGVNVEFVRPDGANDLFVRVWERGCGETFSCGTGACAAVAVAAETGICPKEESVTVHLRGGNLSVRYLRESVLLTGDAQLVYEGYVST